MLTIENLKAFPDNPRAIEEHALAGLGASVQRFGDIAGIVFNRRNEALVAGHQRVRVLRERGAEVEHDDVGRSSVTRKRMRYFAYVLSIGTSRRTRRPASPRTARPSLESSPRR